MPNGLIPAEILREMNIVQNNRDSKTSQHVDDLAQLEALREDLDPLATVVLPPPQDRWCKYVPTVEP